MPADQDGAAAPLLPAPDLAEGRVTRRLVFYGAVFALSAVALGYDLGIMSVAKSKLQEQ